jgi:hypothetical protein
MEGDRICLHYIYYCPRYTPNYLCFQPVLEFAGLAVVGLDTPEKLALRVANELALNFII